MKNKNHILPAILAAGVWFLIAIGGGPVLAQSPGTDSQLMRVPTKPGDICVVCGTALKDSGTAILYKGRRVPLANQEMLQQFLDRPEHYFAKLQPRGALFQEETVTNVSRRWGWFIFGVWVFVALLCAAIGAGLSLRKGYPPVKGFFIGLIGSLFGVAWMAARPARTNVRLPPHLAKLPTTAAPLACPSCGALNHPAAKKCPTCGAGLTPQITSEVERAT